MEGGDFALDATQCVHVKLFNSIQHLQEKQANDNISTRCGSPRPAAGKVQKADV